MSKEFWQALNMVVGLFYFFPHFTLSIQDLTLSH